MNFPKRYVIRRRSYTAELIAMLAVISVVSGFAWAILKGL
jgi:hypothetical protein